MIQITVSCPNMKGFFTNRNNRQHADTDELDDDTITIFYMYRKKHMSFFLLEDLKFSDTINVCIFQKPEMNDCDVLQNHFKNST